jgi:hypothetical protein
MIFVSTSSVSLSSKIISLLDAVSQEEGIESSFQFISSVSILKSTFASSRTVSFIISGFSVSVSCVASDLVHDSSGDDGADVS